MAWAEVGSFHRSGLEAFFSRDSTARFLPEMSKTVEKVGGAGPQFFYFALLLFHYALFGRAYARDDMKFMLWVDFNILSQG